MTDSFVGIKTFSNDLPFIVRQNCAYAWVRRSEPDALTCQRQRVTKEMRVGIEIRHFEYG
jgi:hypothetical protein